MKIELRNSLIAPASEIIFDMPLSGTQSRHRTRLVKLFETQLEQVQIKYKQLVQRNSDVEGIEGMELDQLTDEMIIDMPKFIKERDELYGETFVVSGEEKRVMLESIKDALLECETVWEGKGAVVYDVICEIFEKGTDEYEIIG